jgi:23S rRNA pseudouridine1911/1915/1917 synthase
MTQPINAILHVEANKDDPRLSGALTSLLSARVSNPCSMSPEQLIWIGAIYVNAHRQLEDSPVKCGDYLRIHAQPRRFHLPIIEPQTLVERETDEYLLARKPRGLPTHATLDNVRENLQVFLGPGLLVTHRLDQFTAGLIVFAKTVGFQRRFNHWLMSGRVEKQYDAHTSRPLPNGEMVHYISPEPTPKREIQINPRPGWKRCVLEVIESTQIQSDHFVSRIRLHTGRTHQIRAQLAAIGTPILGDKLYGSERCPPETPPLTSVVLKFPEC